MSTELIIVNFALSLFVLGAVYGLVFLAQRLASFAPHSDASWGTAGAWVPSDPLPLRQVTEHADERERAA